MAKMPPEYPPEPAPYDPDAHRTVADMASDAEEELPDDPIAMDEELITDTKPFITDVYNEMAGVRRKARNAEASTTSSAGPEDSPKVHPTGPASRPPTSPGSNRSPGAASRMSVGDKQEPGEAEREARMVAAEEEATDMHHGRGQTQRMGEHEKEAFGAEEGGHEGEAGHKAAPGGPGHGAGRSATDVPSAQEGGSGQGIREEEGGDSESPEDRARRRAMEQLGNTDRIPPGGSVFLDKEAVLRRQEGRRQEGRP
ncbi:hypothetical protein ABPG75_011080 [Micractinium tetrahymenae]